MSPIAAILLRLLRLYRGSLSPRMRPRCIYHPSCSRYAQEAIGLHGAVRGARLAWARLWRCRPSFMGGLDPVPRRTA